MSKGLENLLNILPVSADYPWGDIKDNTGGGNGTKVNRLNHADYHQTFRKLLALANIMPNNLPDNVTNGYQYIQALDKLYKKFTGVFNDPANATFSLTASHVDKLINIKGNTTTKNFNLPNSNTLRDGDTFTFYNNEPYIAIIQSGTDFVNGGADVTLIQEGDYCELVLDKANFNFVLTQYKATPIPQALPKSVIMYKAGSIGTIASATLKADTVISDGDSLYNSATGRFTPGTVGFYNFSMNLQIEIAGALSSFTTQVLVNKNGTPYIYLAASPYEGGGFSGLLHLSGILQCTNVSDYFTFEYAQSSSQPTTITMSKTFNYIKQ